jgi:hypothetical protein
MRSGFRKLKFINTVNDKGKANIKQVNPALRLIAGRYMKKVLKWL